MVISQLDYSMVRKWVVTDNPIQQVTTQGVEKRGTSLDHPLVGEWFPLDISKGGVGTSLTFQSDGDYVYTAGAFIHFPYRLEGNTLVTVLPEKESIATVELSPTTLILHNGAIVEELTRASK